MKRLLIVISWACLHTAVFAHDFWIEPSTYRPVVGERVELTLRVGDHFLGFPFPRDPHHLVEFVTHDPMGSRPVPGVDGQTPAGSVRQSVEGTIVVGYRSANTTVALEAGAFESYLRKVGLNQVIKTRTAEGRSTKEGREAYSRCAKTILSCGASPGAGYDHLLGFDLEIVPERNPYVQWQDGILPVRVLFSGTPIESIQVAAIHEDDSDPSHFGVTDISGRAHLSIDRPGVWMITAVHMIPAPAELTADWESFWASLTFERVPTE